MLHLIRLVKEQCGGLYSYFSAHAANTMAIAVFFSFVLKNKYKLVAPLLIFWALLVAYSRIYIGVHFPLDAITGILFGAIYGTLAYKMFVKFWKLRCFQK